MNSTEFSSVRKHSSESNYAMSSMDFAWTLGSFCALNKIMFSAEMVMQQLPPPYGHSAIIKAFQLLGFKIGLFNASVEELSGFNFPFLAITSQQNGSPQADKYSIPLNINQEAIDRPCIIVKVAADEIHYFNAGEKNLKVTSLKDFSQIFSGQIYQLKLDKDGEKIQKEDVAKSREFGYPWFLNELGKHKIIWGEILICSLIIQLLALGVPLFTQVVIDKVVVHRTESTLFVIGGGLIIFMIFSALLSWIRQYLILHTGNRVDAVLGSAVFSHLLKIPIRFFENRSTGVISARLHGVETIRDFIASAGVTLILDMPFLLIFTGMMFYYNVVLACIALSIIFFICVMSMVVAPIFRNKLNHQFLLGARNQAFTTEYVSGIETVKSLQMEPQLVSTYGNYLAEYMSAGFNMKQTANTYNVIANSLEQLMSLLILIVGAYTVMHDPGFTIGMLIAFQMFAGKASQPMLKMVGLWQQFQQANMAIQRLGDIMNAPQEPYTIIPNKNKSSAGLISIENLSFRYGEDKPYLYEGINFKAESGKLTAIMGASGSGKSTLAKLLLGFYLPSAGQITIDGKNIEHLAANELRNNFGVVPQETVLFSGTIYENLLMANPRATMDEVVQACRIAELSRHIDEMPDSYQTVIGERGVGLSGGQKQRLAIARALLKKPKILIFDEATSSLDAETAENFASTINKMRDLVTIIFITHSIPKTLLVDKVLRIGNVR